MIDRLIGDAEVLRAVFGFFAWSWPYLFTGLYFGLAIGASAHVVLYKRDVRAAIAWAGLIWLSPIVGSVLYMMFGINRIHRRATRLRGEDEPAIELFGEGGALLRPKRAAGGPSEDAGDLSGLAALRRFLDTVADNPLTEGNRVTPLIDGDEGYPAMLEAIESAQSSVALCTYIFDHDRVGKLFADALAAAHERGVVVRVLIDDVGIRYSRPRITRLLEPSGVPTATFLRSLIPIRNPYLNLRNHRKILVVDGRIGFTGGLNIRESCVMELEPEHAIRDMHFRFDGPVVAHFIDAFALDWEFTTGETLEGERWRPELAGDGTVEARGVPDGPDEDFEAIPWALLGALAVAERSVRIVTPYFLPDQTLIAALNFAAMRGVDVRILLPEHSNLRFVQWASMAQLWQVLAYGCRVWQSPLPFDHSKLMVVDDEWTFVGSANWDARSLRLNFEYNVECYDRELAATVGDLVEQKIAASRELTLDEVNGRSLSVKLRDGIVRLLAPYL